MEARVPTRPDTRFIERACPILRTTALLAAISLAACSTENVTEVEVISVTILPTNAALVEGGTLVFDAIVAEAGGTSIDGAAVLWASDNPDVVVVDESGVALALSNGVATVEASFREVTGSAIVTVLPGPTLVADPLAVSIFGDRNARSPDQATVRVTNGGAGPLAGLAATVEYGDEAAGGWLTTELTGTTTPATLTLVADTDDVEPGVYHATVVVTSEVAGVDPVHIAVRLTLTGFTITEPPGGTAVDERGAMETFTVALDLAPARNIVLSVTSEDPAHLTVSPDQLTFTEADWATPRTVVVTAVDNDIVDGDRTVRARVSVEEADSAYAVLDDQFVEVAILDDDVAGFQVTETGAGTVAREGGPTDTLFVVLTAGPTSDVVFSLRTDDETDATIEPRSLTFTPLDWSVPQMAVFMAVDDDVLDGVGFRTVTIAVDSALSNEAFHGLSRNISAITFDNDFLRAALADPGG